MVTPAGESCWEDARRGAPVHIPQRGEMGSYNQGVRHELRIIDANLNRAREGLRVLEDIARFGLDDAQLALSLKDARHELRGVASDTNLDAAMLAAWRDTPGDVSTGVTTPGERDRLNMRDVAIAAGKRVGEALRTLEECFKTLDDPDAPGARGGAERLKQLRYQCYSLEQRLLLAMGSGKAQQWRLCVLISAALCQHHPWERVAEQAIRGGADCLQLREKSMDAGELLRRAKRLMEIARASTSDGARPSVIINDRPDVALACEADGVHLGQDDLPAREARRVIGFSRLLGVSTTNLAQARAAASDGADYCGVGPMFATTTKEKPALAGPGYMKAYLGAAQIARLPHLAIGGITPANVGELVDAGCRGVAVSSAVCGAPEPGTVCRAILRALESAPSGASVSAARLGAG